MEYEFIINGKKVNLRKRVTVREGQELPRLLQQAGEGDTAAQARVLTILVDNWEFPGDPHDASSYDDLEIFDEFMPLMNAVASHLAARLDRNGTKN